MSCQVARSCTKLSAPVAAGELVVARAPGIRNSSNSAPSALKPVVLRLAILLATTSSSRCSAICRDSPMRSAFSIGQAPLGRRHDPPRPPVVVRPRLSQAAARPALQPPCQIGIILVKSNGWRIKAGSPRGRKIRSAAWFDPAKFSAGSGTKASVNHSYLTSMRRLSRSRLVLRCPPCDRPAHGGLNGKASTAKGEAERRRRGRERTARRSSRQTQAVAQADHHRRPALSSCSAAAAPAPISSSASAGRRTPPRRGGQARGVRRSAGRAGQSVQHRRRPHAISQGQGRARIAGPGADGRRSSR